MPSTLKILLTWLVTATALTSCSLRDDSRWRRDDALYLARGVEVYPESIVLESKEYTAVSSGYITNLWLADTSATAVETTLNSSVRMADALWLREMEQLPHLNGTPLEIYLSRALLDPAEAMEALRASAPEGIISDQQFPEVSGNLAWTAAAWQVYCATGSTAWLKEAYSIARRSLAQRLQVLTSDNGPLIYSAPDYLYPLAPGSASYPSWMGAVDVFQTLSLGTNVWHYATLQALTLMARELSTADADRLAREVSALKESINDTFWVPQYSWYGSYAYGALYPILYPSADNIANPLCVILGIATPEMGRRAVASRPSLPQGFPTLYPVPAGANLKFNSTVQALQLIAAARVRDEEQMLRALGPLWAAAMNENVTSAPWTAAVLRGLLGVTMSPESMTFSPMVPAHFKDGLSLKGLPWREAVLDINVRGAGSKIISFRLDSMAQTSPSVPADLTGRHTIDITLNGNPPLKAATDYSGIKADRQAGSESPLRAPATPRIQWSRPDMADIINYDRDYTYNLYRNGVVTSAIGTHDFSIAMATSAIGSRDRSTTATDSSTVVTAVTAQIGPAESFTPRPHISAPEDACITIPATAITPRRPPLNLIRDRATADRYIELAARHNTRLTFYVNAPRRADYFLSIDYTNGTDNTALRTVEVNGRHAGMLVCPAMTPNNWIKPHPSSVLKVSLNEGVNKISLTYVSTTILLHRINLLRK